MHVYTMDYKFAPEFLTCYLSIGYRETVVFNCTIARRAVWESPQ